MGHNAKSVFESHCAKCWLCGPIQVFYLQLQEGKTYMTEHDAFIQAIVESPDDDGLRLIFADWLDEHDDPRGEFIRIQCALDQPKRIEQGVADLRDRNQKLLNEYGEQWAAPILGRNVDAVRFARGFVNEVEATAHAFLQHGRQWAEQHPFQVLLLRNVAGRAERLAACAHLRIITQLTVDDRRFGDADVIALARSHHLARLVWLTVQGTGSSGGTQVGDEGLRQVAAAPYFASLTHLSITSDGSVGTLGAEAVAAAGESRLERLCLGWGAIDDRGAAALAGGTGFKALSWLSLTQNWVSDDGLLSLVTSPYLSLERLWLDYNHVTPEGLAALGEVSTTTLKSISLRGNPIASVDMDAIASFLDANRNVHLNLQSCPLPKGVQKELSRRFGGRVASDHPARPCRISG